MIKYPVKVIKRRYPLCGDDGVILEHVDGFTMVDADGNQLDIDEITLNTIANSLNAMNEFPISTIGIMYGKDCYNIFKILGWLQRFKPEKEIVGDKK